MMLENHSDDFTALQIHIWDGGYDTTWGNARKTFYGVGGTPTIWFDGVLGIEGTYGSAAADYAQYNSRYLTRKGVATDVNITLSAEPIASQTYHVSALVEIEGGGAGKTMRVHIAQVLDNWPTSPSYSRNTFKQASAYQDVYIAAGGGSNVEADFTVDATSWANRDDIIFVAWAQNTLATGPSEVYQAAFMRWPFPFDECNDNDIPDLCDTDCGAYLPDGTPCTDWPGCGGSADSNGNGVPDECEMYTVPAGDDCGTTECGAAQVDFASQPLPADFFGPGSDPFDGVISLGNPMGDVDTVVARQDVMNFMYPLPSEQVVPIEMVSLNLVSCEPIEVAGFGLWDVEMTLSPATMPPGTLTATKTHANGGTFDAVFYVQPVYTFTQLDPPYDVKVWDTAAQSVPPFLMEQVAEGPWSADEFCEACDVDGYIQGIAVDDEEDGCAVEVCFAADGFTHCITPPGCPVCVACCIPDGSCALQDGIAGCTDAGGWANEPGSVCAGDGDGNGIDDACQESGCSECGPGDHWIDTCEGSIDRGAVVNATFVIDLSGNCQPDEVQVVEGVHVSLRSGPLDDSVYFPGSAPVDGHLEVIDTELAYLELTGPGLTVLAGQHPQLTNPINPSLGAIVEQPGDPALGDHVIEAYFQVTLAGWWDLYNLDPLPLTAVVDCAAPRAVYTWGGCTTLWTNPTPGIGSPFGNLLSVTFEVFPSDCPDNPVFDPYPPDGTIDARRPHPSYVSAPLYGFGMPDDPGTGVDESTLTPIVIDLGVSGAAPNCFTLCEVPPGDNAIVGVTEEAPGMYRIDLDHGCAAGAVTTIQYNGGDYVSYAHHPSNTDGSGYANANDITVVVDCMYNPGSCEDWAADTDFSGTQTANDIIDTIDLLNGASFYAPGWFNTPVPENDGSCP